MQLSLNFLIPPQPVTPLNRLEPEQHDELVHALARIITKAAGHAGSPPNTQVLTTTPTKGDRHD